MKILIKVDTKYEVNQLLNTALTVKSTFYKVFNY